MYKKALGTLGSITRYAGPAFILLVSGIFLFSAALSTDLNIRQVTTDQANDLHAKWSPDGKTLAFNSWRSGELKIWLTPADGGDATLLETGLSGDHHVSWAPDRKRIAFDATWEGRPNIFAISLDGGELKRLSKEGTVDFLPCWSPDGSHIAFTSLRSGNQDIWIISSEGDQPLQLTNDDASDRWPVWSPDGSKIAFTSNRSGNFDIWIVPAAGGELKQLTFNESHDDQPCWSPDGTRIAFMSKRGENWDIWIASISGGEPIRFTEGSNNSRPSWSPDGKKIAFTSDRTGNSDIWVKDVKQDDFPELTGSYLGQKPPGMTPEVFAPGIVSSTGFIDFKGAFSRDGQEYYFYRHALPEILPVLLFTRIENGGWTKPVPLPIAQGARTSHPCVSMDNNWLFFFWQFQPEQNRPSGFYASARTPTGWSDPRYAGPGMYLTCDNSGRFYTTESVWGDQPKHYLASMTFSQGRFSRPERLTIRPHYENQTHPCIAPDGSYILFDINVEDGSLFVSFKDENGQWGEGIDLTKHGFKPDSRGAYISPDGKYLFFSVDDDIWWVSSKVIEVLRPKEAEKGASSPSGEHGALPRVVPSV